MHELSIMFMIAFWMVVVAVGYFLPAIIAAARSHHNAGAILALNLLLGWTMLGWVGALVWSLTQTRHGGMI